ncbi:hypothetical protein MM236_11535 [Belliella sp. DSM 107340]|uniref:Glycosyltransferase n=1 Tax=Belliella calami TaxID=2923436 RepID=A0ABS9UPS1_9BACT|nr:hypothetical protein [Belliella calami]MCH7398628.1 hypothetical protein [Belliella calami]
MILTHSNEGIEFVRESYPRFTSKVHFIVHPIQTPFHFLEKSTYKYDLLIWGSIQPYKGILQFLKFINSNEELKKLKILIVGKCPDKGYLKLLKEEFSNQVSMIDSVLSLEKISVLAQNSKFVFFPYNSPSLLSSGVLMDSLRMHSKILGPNSGSFKDLSYLSGVEVYDDFKDLLSFFNEGYDLDFDRQEMKKFCEENTWEKFSFKFLNFYNHLN